jgi:hypothetical protein
MRMGGARPRPAAARDRIAPIRRRGRGGVGLAATALRIAGAQAHIGEGSIGRAPRRQVVVGRRSAVAASNSERRTPVLRCPTAISNGAERRHAGPAPAAQRAPARRAKCRPTAALFTASLPACRPAAG